MTKRTCMLLLAAILIVAAVWGVGCTEPSADAPSSTAPGSTLAPASSATVAAAPSPTITSTTLPRAPSTTTATTEPAPILPLEFDSELAMEHIRKLAKDIGIRPGGSEAENEALAYAASYLTGLGYDPVITEVPLPDGKTSHNLTVVKPGRLPLAIAIGGHLDTKKTTPGANDDASGVAAVLELARDVAEADVVPTIYFICFGTEEIIDSNDEHHHYGSRAWVKEMKADQRESLAAMISLDMIAYGQTFHVRTMGKGPRTLRDMLQTEAEAQDVDLVYLKDPGASGYSDHEPFELAGYPAAWLQWRVDPTYHKMGDTYEHCSEKALNVAGDFLQRFLTELSEQDLEELHAAVTPR